MDVFKELYGVYLIKHKAEPFVMLDEINLTFEEFIKLIKTSYSFNQMWGSENINAKYTAD